MKQNKSNQFLLVCDFDGTIADTFTPSPNGFGVHEAYEYAIEQIFGKNGLSAYRELGGLQNMAPSEVVNNLFDTGNSSKLISKAYAYFVKNRQILKNLVPEGKGYPMEWSGKIHDPGWNPEYMLTEILVRTKMSLMMGDVGKQLKSGKTWPQPCLGINKFFQILTEINKENKIHLELAILSSGHDLFIMDTFKSWGIDCPKIMVTDDDMRRLSLFVKLRDRIKP